MNTQTQMHTTRYSKHYLKRTANISTLQPHIHDTDVTKHIATVFQHKKIKTAEQQNNTFTTQQEHTAKPHTKQ
jgi:hypothetical protein